MDSNGDQWKWWNVNEKEKRGKNTQSNSILMFRLTAMNIGIYKNVDNVDSDNVIFIHDSHLNFYCSRSHTDYCRRHSNNCYVNHRWRQRESKSVNGSQSNTKIWSNDDNRIHFMLFSLYFCSFSVVLSFRFVTYFCPSLFLAKLTQTQTTTIEFGSVICFCPVMQWKIFNFDSLSVLSFFLRVLCCGVLFVTHKQMISLSLRTAFLCLI